MKNIIKILFLSIMLALAPYSSFATGVVTGSGNNLYNQSVGAGSNVYNNYISDYTNINNDIKQAKQLALQVGSQALDAGINLYNSIGFFTVTPTVRATNSPPYFTTNYFSVCFGEKSIVSSPPGNTIFDPKIKVYNELVISCLGIRNTVTLSAFGQCKYIGLQRFCARFTAPCRNDNNRCCGSDSCSAPNPNSNSCPNCKQAQAYRICAFNDPPIPIDPNDNNYNLMPFHKNSPVPPKVTGGDNIIALGAVIMAAGIIVPGLGEGTMLIGAAMMMAGGIMELIEVITSTINYVVIANVGCIDVPLAPSPPPFFSSITSPYPTPSILSICHNSAEYTYSAEQKTNLINNGLTAAQVNALDKKQISMANAICEIGGSAASPQYSTFENPVARIFFDNPVPICPSGTNPGNDVCVLRAQNIDTPNGLQQATKGLLPICATGTNSNCITFPSGRTAGGPFRTYYNVQNKASLGITIGNNLAQSTPYIFIDPTMQTLSLAGINDNLYADVAAGNSVNFQDTNGNSRSFYVGLDTTGDRVCVTDTTTANNRTEVGCLHRPIPLNPPTVTSCCIQKTGYQACSATSNTCLYTGSENLSAQPRILVSLGSPAKTAIIGVDTIIPDPNSSTTPQGTLAPTAYCIQDDVVNGTGTSSSNKAPCYIYGAQFSSYITDNDNSTPDVSPTGDGTITPAGCTAGIQYSKGVYCRGATKICLSGYTDPSKTVIAKMIAVVTDNTTTPPTTKYVVSNKMSDRVIPPANAALPLANFFNKATGYVAGSSATSTRLAFGFKQTSTGGIDQFFENSACSSGGTTCTAVANSYPSATSCSCPDNTVSPATTRPCRVQGCEWAFQISDPAGSRTTSYTGFTDGTNQYPLTGTPSYGERPANAMELGLCSNMVTAICPAITTPGANDGNATWTSASAGSSATGTCLTGSQSTGTPTRLCWYNDTNGCGGYTAQTNGCPASSTVAFQSVTNGCAVNIPSWWPSEFLYAHSEFQGAIVNQFNVVPEYMSKVIPTTANTNPLKKITTPFGSSISLVNPTKPEPWVSSPTAPTDSDKSCKTGYTINLSLTPRTSTDGDQEMLYITRANWRAIWNRDWNSDGKLDDLNWLLADNNTYNGCYVYNVNNMLNATISNATVGLKICKSGSKVSFSLVDLAAISATNYTNTAYIMQSNIIAYDKIDTIGNGYNYSLPLEHTITNSVAPNTYRHFINHGFVVNKTGFTITDAALAKAPPADFVSINTPESVKVEYAFTGVYSYSTSGGNYHRYTNYTSSGGQGYVSSYSPEAPVEFNSCALAIYRKAVNYSSTVNSLDYFAIPSTLNFTSANKIYPSSYTTPYVSSLYLYTSYNGNNSDSSWPYQDGCHMMTTISNYVHGNSAANPSMFLWSSPTNYSPCNN